MERWLIIADYGDTATTSRITGGAEEVSLVLKAWMKTATNFGIPVDLRAWPIYQDEGRT